MTNPNNIVRVRARNGGRASVYEANGWAQMLAQGLLEGNGVTQNTSADMNVLVGGTSTNPDVLVAQNPSGYKIALDIVGQQAIAITAPASGSRITSIVAYTDDLSLSTTEDTITGSPSSCGLIVVNGDTSSNPVAPDDTAIRSAITADGATGSQACYVVIANITVASSTTAITNSLISINKAAVTSDKLDFTTYETGEQVVGTWIDGRPLYRKVMNLGNVVADTEQRISHDISNIGIIWISNCFIYRSSPTPLSRPFNYFYSASQFVQALQNDIRYLVPAAQRPGDSSLYVVLEYTKTSD